MTADESKLLQVAQAKADRAIAMLRVLLLAFPELSTSLSSAPQQAVLREVRAILAEVGHSAMGGMGDPGDEDRT